MNAKRKRILASLVSLALILFVSGCGKKASQTTETSGRVTQESPRPEKLKAINLGQAEGFALLAYANITSNPTSSINGKVGLMPGTREMISLDPSEVKGGASDIMGSDDETNPINILSNAKVDMVTAYAKAVSLSPDLDKIELLIGTESRKALKPGVYKWNGDLNLTNDFSLDGNEDSIWIFKIHGHMNVSSGVHMFLNGGARARNVFWQVSGSAVLESNSDISGTILAQQFVEIKNHAALTGRAFVKNGYISLNQATINRP